MLPEDQPSPDEDPAEWTQQPSNLPDCWPPKEPEVRGGTAPLFALEGVFLFPGQLQQLHIFEARYREMIEDILDGPGRFIFATTEEGDSAEDAELETGAPAVLPIAGLAEVMRHQKMPDGRFLIWVFGVCRVRLDEVPSQRLYRCARYQVLEDTNTKPDLADGLLEPTRSAILSRIEELLNLPADVPLGLLADLLLQSIPMPQSEMEQYFNELCATSRAQLALEAHARYPIS